MKKMSFEEVWCYQQVEAQGPVQFVLSQSFEQQTAALEQTSVLQIYQESAMFNDNDNGLEEMKRAARISVKQQQYATSIE